MADFSRESMLDMFIYEMNQLVEQLEQLIIEGEQGYSMESINEIFRIMHTIKGSSAMMLYDNVSKTAHNLEDLFFYLRESNPSNVNYSNLTDLVLEGVDFIKIELEKIEGGEEPDADPTNLIDRIESFLDELKAANGDSDKKSKSKTKNKESTAKPSDEKPKETVKADTDAVSSDSAAYKYTARVFFEDGCEMENVRAFGIIQNLKDVIRNVQQDPEDITEEGTDEIIRKNGFLFTFESDKNYNELSELINNTIYLKSFELSLSDTHKFEAVLFFEDGCEMENVRAYTVIHTLKNYAANINHVPEDVIDEAAIDIIRKDGFRFNFETPKSYDEVMGELMRTVFLRELDLKEISSSEESKTEDKKESAKKTEEDVKTQKEDVPEDISEDVSKEVQAEVKPASVPAAKQKPPAKTKSSANEKAPAQKKQAPTQHMISVNISKLDELLNLMGELVISEAMTTQNPDLEGLELENFNKSARQLRKIINDVQDTVMSMRMVSLSTTFFKMHRIVRDMCKNLGKDVQLEVVGEETEVDKNIIEHLSDPLMHIIRNSVDHGIETPEVRKELGKPEKGTVLLEARNSGGEVLIIVKDDGQGLDKDKILAKARKNGLLKKPESEYTDREIHQFIFHPGLSTNENVTAYSGRGVGMDVVVNNLETVGGTISVESEPGEGTTNILKIPLTLAIIEGMLIKMGGAKYTIPISSIQETFKAKEENIFTDPDGNEMLTLRGEVYNIVRLYDFFNAKTEITNIEDGVLIMLENEDKTICLLVDELIGEQQVVVKTMPKYIKRIKGISGCTLLGNGDISLIIDVPGFFDK